jgi:hypothetical protein
MLITMPLGTPLWFTAEKEDIHGERVGGCQLSTQRQFQFFSSAMGDEEVFTDAWKKPRWENTADSLERTEELRTALPELLKSLEITSVVDCGCGDFVWQKTVDWTGIQYLGVDIVKPRIEKLQSEHTTDNTVFQYMNILQDPPETADLWLARDLLPTLGLTQSKLFLKKYLESQSPYLAITSVESRHDNKDALPGAFRWLDVRKSPFSFPEPSHILPDGDQWRKKKFLYVYTRMQILEAMALNPTVQTTVEVVQPSKPIGTQGKNDHLVSNVPLRQMNIRAHMGSGMPYRA